LQQNAQAYVSRLDQRKPVAQRIKAIFNAPDKAGLARIYRGCTALRCSATKLVQRDGDILATQAAIREETTSAASPLSQRIRSVACADNLRMEHADQITAGDGSDLRLCRGAEALQIGDEPHLV
jgi:hypothetical protein